MVSETVFSAMGTRAQVLVVGGPDGSTHRARARIAQLEERWSRFLPDSEVSALNGARGRPVEVSSDTLRLVQLAVSAWSLTGGVFDPTTLPALEAAGYTRSFDEMQGRSTSHMAVGAPGCAAIELDLERRTVRLPDEVRFDPGGIGKGLAADIVVAQLLADGADGVLVNLGGDLVARGQAPGGESWTIEIVEPTASDTSLGTISFTEGALATSAVTRRRWPVAGGTRHHLIDPSTGGAPASPVVLASVLASAGWVAEVAATWRLAATDATSALAALPAVTLRSDGSRALHSGMEDFLS